MANHMHAIAYIDRRNTRSQGIDEWIRSSHKEVLHNIISASKFQTVNNDMSDHTRIHRLAKLKNSCIFAIVYVHVFLSSTTREPNAPYTAAGCISSQCRYVRMTPDFHMLTHFNGSHCIASHYAQNHLCSTSNK